MIDSENARLSEAAAHLTWVCEHATELMHRVIRPLVGRYESDVTATGLTLLSIRHAEAVALCVLWGPSGFIPAAACARAAFETAVTAAWLQVPENPFEREGRWLGYYKGMERFYRNLAAEHGDSESEVVDGFVQYGAQHELWRSRIEASLPIGAVVDRPSVPAMLKELGASPLYRVYRAASQIVHGEPPALEYVMRTSYERDDPASTEPVFRATRRAIDFGVFVTPDAAVAPLRLASYGVTRATMFLAARARVAEHELGPLAERHSMLLKATERPDSEDE